MLSDDDLRRGLQGILREHLGEETLLDHVEGLLRGADLARARLHLQRCEICRTRVEKIARQLGEAAEPDSTLAARGRWVGRVIGWIQSLGDGVGPSLEPVPEGAMLEGDPQDLEMALGGAMSEGGPQDAELECSVDGLDSEEEAIAVSLSAPLHWAGRTVELRIGATIRRSVRLGISAPAATRATGSTSIPYADRERVDGEDIVVEDIHG